MSVCVPCVSLGMHKHGTHVAGGGHFSGLSSVDSNQTQVVKLVRQPFLSAQLSGQPRNDSRNIVMFNQF